MSNVHSFILILFILLLFLFTSCGLEKYKSEALQDFDDICCDNDLVIMDQDAIYKTDIDEIPEEFVDEIPEEFVDEIPEEFVDEIPEEFVDEIPEEFVDEIPEEFVDEIPEEFVDEDTDEDQTEYIPEECRVLEPGIVLTFDDFLVNEWYQAHLDLFLENDVKATFFLHKVYLLKDDSEKLQKVLEMQSFGHEMGCHTMNHVKLTDYLAVKTIDEYLDEEIEPSISTAKSLGIDFKSFAYPYGVGTEDSDNLLLNYFSALRYTAGGVSAKRDNIFYNNKCNRIIFSGGTDAPSNPTKEKISEAINKAFDEKKVLVLLGHEITKEAPGNHPYYVTYELLEWIISEAKEKNMKFYTVSEIFSGQNEVEPEEKIFSIYK